MNDKDRELLVQALHEAGKVGQAGFDALVRWQFMDGLTTVVCTIGALAVLLYLFSRLIEWKAQDEACVAKGAGLVVVALVAVLLVTAALPAGIREMLAPEGAAVAYALAHH